MAVANAEEASLAGVELDPSGFSQLGVQLDGLLGLGGFDKRAKKKINTNQKKTLK